MKLIVAVDRNWGIGHQNQLQVHIPADLARFKTLTSGHPVLLGRKTLDTFPGGRPLKGRRNLILSDIPNDHVEGAEIYSSLEDILAAAPEDTFVIGGETIYRLMLPYCDTAYITKLNAALPADRWFPNLDTNPAWAVAEEEPPLEHEGLQFCYVTYKRA
jgi:dihydrofolate reductase